MSIPPSVPPRPEDRVALEAMAVELAQGAARIVTAGRAGELTIATKSTATDLVTEVDTRVERWLADEIGRRRPGDAVLGEEGGEQTAHSTTGASTGVRWVLDPIDGTVNFVLGIPQFAVSVAAEVDGVIVAGAVCNPMSGETFRASLGGGSYLGEQRLAGPRDIALPRAVIGTGFAYDAGRRAVQVAVVAPLLPLVGDVRRLGSAALDLCFVASGRLDGYFESGLNYWDWAAAALVATEAGCVVSGPTGGAPSATLVAAAGPALAGELFGLLESLGAGRSGSADVSS